MGRAGRSRRTGRPFARPLAALLAALAVVLGAAPALAYEAPSGPGTGTPGFGGSRNIPFPSGMSVRAAVSGNIEVQSGLTLSSIGNPAASHYQPEVDPARAYAIQVRTLPLQNCPADSVCPAGTVTVTFKHPVRDPVLNLAGLGAGVNGAGLTSGTFSQLTLTGSDRPVEVGRADPGATLLVAGRTIRPRSGAAQANCQDANTSLRAGCGSVPLLGTVTSLTFSVDFVTQAVAVPPNAETNGRDDWALSALVQNDCSNAPASYGSASHVIGDLTLGPDATEDLPGTAITRACRVDGDENDLNPAFGTLTAGTAGRPYSLTVPVSGAGTAARAAAWIDFDRDGTFSAAELATVTVPPGGTSATFTWTVPPGVVPGPTWSRFRLGFDQAQVDSPTGMADSGEVEDWPLTIAPAPSLTLTKAADPVAVGRAGDRIVYTYTVTNSGTFPITDPVVDETSFSGTGTAPRPVCPADTLAPGASTTCTAAYDATQADVDAGRIDNTAVATGTPPPGMNPPVSPEASATVTAAARPDLGLRKTAAETGPLQVGQVLHYSFEVTNTGNVTLTGVTVDETAFTGSGTVSPVVCPPGAASLAPGAVITCTAGYTVTQADVNGGSVENTATATGTPPGGGRTVSDPSSTAVPFVPRPSLDVDKRADRQRLTVGETLTYTYEVTNTGNVTLTGITVTEGAFTGSAPLPPVTCPNAPVTLEPGRSVGCTAAYVVTQADVDAGRIDNAATATGTPPGGTPVTSPPGTTTVTADREPAMTVVKSADRERLVAGESVTYTYTVTNTGNVTLTAVAVAETEWTGSGPAPRADCPAGPLAPGASVTCTARYTVTQQDADRGTLRNSATATGVPPGGGTPVTSPPSSVVLPHESRPALGLQKRADPSVVRAAGEQVVYTFLVTNTGNVTLTDVTVTETAFTGGGEAPEIGCPDDPLPPGAVVACTAHYAVTQADVDAGTVRNAATATAAPPPGLGRPVSPEVSATVTAPPRPHLTLRKTAAGTGPLQAGQVLHYSFELTNNGNVTLAPVRVDEGVFTGSGTLSPVVCPDGAASLAPGAVITCTAEYTVTQTDVNGGLVENTATATGTPPGGGTPVTSPPGAVTVPFVPRPSLVVEKSADRQHLVAGETVTYSYLVTNTGNTTLTGITVTEGAFSGSGRLSAVSCPDGAVSLDPGRVVTCTATYVVTQADVDAGRIDNAATAGGTPPGGTPVTSPPGGTSVTTEPRPALTVVKSADRERLVVGQTVTYTYAVTNTGNVTLTGITVDETAWTGSGPAPRVGCPEAAGSLAPGAQVLCTATYVVTQADADRGTVRNTATATGTPPGRGTPVTSPPSTATVPHESRPALVLEKTAAPASVGRAGEQVVYTYTITNTGNVTLTGVGVTETAFTGTGGRAPVVCRPADEDGLRPGQQLLCSTAYVVTQADVDAGAFRNTAVATGTPPGGGSVTSPPSTADVTGVPAPGLSLVKSADRASAAVGEDVTYAFTLTNTGNVTLTGVTVTESAFNGSGALSPVSCPAGSLGVGERLVCTAGYRVTSGDAARGALDNTATAAGTPPGGGRPATAPPSTATVTVRPGPLPAPPSAPGVLPHTGATALGTAAAGTASLLAGGSLTLLTARRRRRRP
ncbi:GEVED domain-containing protein [Kitasatospora sp. NPDC056327]|uniref:DUF7507 domain-containing protein n=1 Tax=Kitasatospora sp. NPDC056327 TaxID=3345785 RepID=UPI0035DD8FCE